MTPEQKSSIEWQCQQLALKFIAHGDRQEWAEMCALLTEDAVFARPTDPDNPITGRGKIQAAFESRPRGKITRHLCTNIIVTAESPTEARGSLYALLFTGSAANQGDLAVTSDPRQLVGGFEDRYVLTDAGWRIAERRGSLTFATE